LFGVTVIVVLLCCLLYRTSRHWMLQLTGDRILMNSLGSRDFQAKDAVLSATAASA